MAEPGNVPITLRADAATRAVVDVCDGIDRVMGDRRLYGRMLQRFSRDYQRGLAPLRAARAAADRVDAECFASSLAGASGMIGAKALQRQATLVGATLRQPGSPGAVEAEMKKLESALGKVLRVLDQMLFGDAPPDAACAAPVARSATGDVLPADTALLTQLRALLLSGDGAAVDLLAASRLSLEAVLGAAPLRQLAAALHRFDFAAALGVLDAGAGRVAD
ncbi:MAG: hypothetical protein ABIV04_16210 [Massilia sp.]